MFDNEKIFNNKISKEIYDVLESYKTAFTLSREDAELKIQNFSEYNFYIRYGKGYVIDIVHIKIHPNLSRKNIEVYSIERNILKQMITNERFKKFIQYNEERSKLSRLGIKNGIMFFKNAQQLREFLSVLDEYI